MQTIGALTDARYSLREQKRSHEEAIKQLDDLLRLNEIELLAMMEKEGVTRAAGKAATISVSEIKRPNVTDWDDFYKYIHKNKYYHLLERRPAASACNELFELKGKIPGVVPFTQKRINMRAAT